MQSYLLFKKWRRHLFLRLLRGRVWGACFLLLPLFSSVVGCSRTPCKLTNSDLARTGLCGPVRSMLYSMGGIRTNLDQPDTLHPNEWREFDREGHLTLLLTFGSSIEDTVSASRRFFNEKGFCTKVVNGRREHGSKWRWTRIEYGYTPSDTLLWQAEFGDTTSLIPHTVIGYSSKREDELHSLTRWKGVDALKIVYLDERRVPLGEQWVKEGKSYGVIRYDTTVVEAGGKRFTRYQLPPENIKEYRSEYVADYYDSKGHRVEQWKYQVNDYTGRRYSYTDLQTIQRFDSLGRQIALLIVAGDTTTPLDYWRFDLDTRGDILLAQKITYASFGAFLRGEATGEITENRFDYSQPDNYDNWKAGAIKSGKTGTNLGVLRRSFTYY